MKIHKRITGIVLAAVMAASSLAFTSTAYAADPQGSGPVSVWDFGGIVEADGTTYTNYLTPDILDSWQAVGDGENETTKGIFVTKECDAGAGLVVNANSGSDRLYYQTGAGTRSNGAQKGYTEKSFSDGYNSTGGVYFNGTGGTDRRNVVINDVKALSEVRAYVWTSKSGTDLITNFEYLGTDGTQKITTDGTPDPAVYKFIAKYDGSYKIWFDAASGAKPMVYRVVKTPPTKVDFTVNEGSYSSALSGGYNVKLINDETGEESVYPVTNGSASAVITPGYSYSASLSGIQGYGFTNSSRKFKVELSDLVSGSKNVTLDVETKTAYNVTGSIKGLAEGYDTKDLTLTFVPEDTMSYDSVTAAIDKSALTYSAELTAGTKYTLKLEGACDYKISEEITIPEDNEAAVVKDVVLSALPKQDVSGSFIGLTQTRGIYDKLNVTPSELTFKNLADNYTYSGTISAGSYTASLRAGSYIASITDADGQYSTTTHVVVGDSAVSRDILLKDEKPAATAFSDTIEVGSDKAYKTVQSAVDAVGRMTDRGDRRVTVKIDPGTYREQVVVNYPNITFESASGNPDDTVITWYYGIGYKYYSCVDSYYNPYADYDKFEKGSVVSYWGSAVITNKDATGFRAKGITFENSFNKYLTTEELDDGVELNGAEKISVVRNKAADVTTKAATERAAALVNYADKVECLDCRFIGSQDTLMTGNVAAINSYYKNCYIEGMTDFIYGTGDVIFDGCEISFCGYGDSENVGYLTANSNGSNNQNVTDGYIFRGCYISYADKLGGKTPVHTPGYFGRMWGPSAMVTFIDSQLEDENMILGAGWSEMDKNQPTAPTVKLVEYNTTYGGNKVSTSLRIAGTAVDSIDADKYSVETVFGRDSWTPAYYTADVNTTPEFKNTTTPLSWDTNGDMNALTPGSKMTVSYELGSDWADSDASRIDWYAVSPDVTGEEALDVLIGKAELLASVSAVSSKSYQIPMECAGKYIMVVVTPITVNGKAGTPAHLIDTIKPVSETWSDPDNQGSLAPGQGINVYLAGDSTVTNYGTGEALGSWGEFLHIFLDDTAVTVNDTAKGGRSTRQVVNEGTLDDIAKNIKKGDYLFIQFGHNDCYNRAGDMNRFVPLVTPQNGKTADGKFPTVLPTEDMKGADGKYAWDCGATYKGFLQAFVNVALEAEATPVIVSPVSRMYFTNGKIRPHHDTYGPNNGPGNMDPSSAGYIVEEVNNTYVTACEELYEENVAAGKNVLYLDNFNITKDLFEEAYAEAGNDSLAKVLMSSGDSTHCSKTGGAIEAGLVAKWIKEQGITLSNYVIQPENAYGVLPSGDFAFEIDNKAFTAKDSDLVKSDYWSAYGQELFDSLGEKIPVTPTVLLGDVDGDKLITSNDAALTNIIAAQNGTDESADVDGDGKVTTSDAAQILEKVLRASHKFPAENKAA